MEDEELNSYDFYVTNFDYIKYLIDERHKNVKNNIILIIFYDVELYKKYIKIKLENDFKRLIWQKMEECEFCSNEDDGVFIIYGNLTNTIDIVINDVFGEKRRLSEKECESIGILPNSKTPNTFYISLLQIIFCGSKAEMKHKFEIIKNKFLNEEIIGEKE